MAFPRRAIPRSFPYMLDELRDALGAFSSRLNPDERRRATHGMRDALVHAKLALRDLAAAKAATEARLQAERTELETVRRRMGYAVEIGDTETVAIAERFAAQHAERVAMLETKLMAQEQELTVTERDYEAMSVELRRVMSGLPRRTLQLHRRRPPRVNSMNCSVMVPRVATDRSAEAPIPRRVPQCAAPGPSGRPLQTIGWPN